jgi:hypothetical protein
MAKHKKKLGRRPKPASERGQAANSYYNATTARLLADIGQGSVSAGAKIVAEFVTAHRDNALFREIIPAQNPTKHGAK